MDGISLHNPAPEVSPVEPVSNYKLHRRFDRMARLTGDDGMSALMNSFVIVFGIGGVGSFTAEALVRSGIGRIRIVDFDDVCVTNTNRQLHAMKGNIGKPKVELMAERLRRINPLAKVEAVKLFYQAETSEDLLEGEPDFVVDAIDQFTAKCHLIATCKQREIPLVCSMGGRGQVGPDQDRGRGPEQDQELSDGGQRSQDSSRKACISEGRAAWGISAVYSTEFVQPPRDLAYDAGTGFVCVCPQGENGLLTCDRRARIDGSASFVTGAFGLAAAAVVVRKLTEKAEQENDG